VKIDPHQDVFKKIDLSNKINIITAILVIMLVSFSIFSKSENKESEKYLKIRNVKFIDLCREGFKEFAFGSKSNGLLTKKLYEQIEKNQLVLDINSIVAHKVSNQKDCEIFTKDSKGIRRFQLKPKEFVEQSLCIKSQRSKN
jgi:hypothetical protein